MKIMFIIIVILILLIVILALIIKSQNKKLKQKDNQINSLTDQCKEREDKINLLTGEIEIEKQHTKELAKKLADIGCMSIDDVLHQLQNNNG